MRNYWIPKYKWELVAWFTLNMPSFNVKGWSKAKLYAVYFKLRDKLR